MQIGETEKVIEVIPAETETTVPDEWPEPAEAPAEAPDREEVGV